MSILVSLDKSVTKKINAITKVDTQISAILGWLADVDNEEIGNVVEHDDESTGDKQTETSIQIVTMANTNIMSNSYSVCTEINVPFSLQKVYVCFVDY